jgi:hypothetical protein
VVMLETAAMVVIVVVVMVMVMVVRDALLGIKVVFSHRVELSRLKG